MLQNCIAISNFLIANIKLESFEIIRQLHCRMLSIFAMRVEKKGWQCSRKFLRSSLRSFAFISDILLFNFKTIGPLRLIASLSLNAFSRISGNFATTGRRLVNKLRAQLNPPGAPPSTPPPSSSTVAKSQRESHIRWDTKEDNTLGKTRRGKNLLFASRNMLLSPDFLTYVNHRIFLVFLDLFFILRVC